MIGLSFSWCSFSSSASNKQRAAVSMLLFTIAMLLMFHSIGEKISLNFNTLGEKWGKLSHCNLRLCWPVKGWIVCQWADLMRQQMKNVIEIFQFFLLYYVKFTTLEGRWRCCSVCQQSEISHCSPRRTDWTSLVSDAILIQLDRLSVVRLWLRGASSFSFVTDNIQHHFLPRGIKLGSNFMCLYVKVKRPNQPNATLWNEQTKW